MKQIANWTPIAALLLATLFTIAGCATPKRDAIVKQLDAVSGATKKIGHQ